VINTHADGLGTLENGTLVHEQERIQNGWKKLDSTVFVGT
jgi:hypothetical protein